MKRLSEKEQKIMEVFWRKNKKSDLEELQTMTQVLELYGRVMRPYRIT